MLFTLSKVGSVNFISMKAELFFSAAAGQLYKVKGSLLGKAKGAELRLLLWLSIWKLSKIRVYVHECVCINIYMSSLQSDFFKIQSSLLWLKNRFQIGPKVCSRFSISYYGTQWIEFPQQRQPGRQLGKIETWRRTQNRGNYTKEGAKKSPPQPSRCSPCGHSKAAVRDRPFPSTVMIASYDQPQGSSRTSSNLTFLPFYHKLTQFVTWLTFTRKPPQPKRDLSKLEILHVLYFIILTEQHLYARQCKGSSDYKIQRKESKSLRNSQSITKHVYKQLNN